MPRVDPRSDVRLSRGLRALPSALEALLLVAIQLLLMWGFWKHVDIHIVDEVHYYYRGISLLRGELSAMSLAWGPLYSLAYGLLSLLPLGQALPLDLMGLITGVGSVLALWWCTRPLLKGPLAVLLAAWCGASPLLLNSGRTVALQGVYAFGLMLLALAIGAFVRGRRWTGAALLVALCLVRIESALILLTAGVLLALLSRREARRATRRPALLILTAGAIFLLAALFHPGVKRRSWLAFKQHHAQLALIISGDPAPALPEQPFSRPDRWIRADFPGARSVGQAVIENPGTFGAHVLFNLRSLPRALARLYFDGFSHLGVLRTLALCLGGLLAGAGLLRRQLKLGAVLSACPAPVWALLASGLASVPVALSLSSRAELMMPAVPIGLLLWALLVRDGWRAVRGPLHRLTGGRLDQRSPHLQRWSGAAAGALVLTAVVVGRPVFPATAARPLVHRVSSAIVRARLPDDRPHRLLGVNVGSYLKLSGKREAHRFYDLGASQDRAHLSFSALVKRTRPDYILVTPLLFAVEGLHPGISDEISSPRWHAEELRPGYRWLSRAPARR